MTSHSFPKINQKEYLKKYLSGDKVKKKKKDKKRKKSSPSAKVKIIDDDINTLDTGIEIDEDLLLVGEDAPQIVGEYIEDVPPDSKAPKWKCFAIKNEPEDENDTTNRNQADLWGQKSDRGISKAQYFMSKSDSSRLSDYSSRRKERKRLSPLRSTGNTTPEIKSETHSTNSKGKSSKQFTESLPKIKTEPQSPQYKTRRRNRSQSSDISPPRKIISERPSSPIVSNRKQSRHRKHSDQSPSRVYRSSRKSRSRSPYQTNSRQRKDSDQSPPRITETTDRSPARRRNNFNNSTLERRKTPTKGRKRSPFQSPNRRGDSDQSPPRKGKHIDKSSRHRNRDECRTQRTRTRNSSDDSPARINRQRRQTPDISPTGKSRRTPDQSPPRRKRNLDQSPHTKTKNSVSNYCRRTPDQSHSRRKRQSSVEPSKNSSPARIKREKLTSDLSPQLRSSRWEEGTSRQSDSPPPTHKPKPGKTLEGKRAGLQDAKALKEETMERRKQEDMLFEKMSSDVSGRLAEVQVRSTGRKGRRAREAEKDDPEERRRKEEHEEKKKLLYDRWGKGLKQIEDHKNRMQELEYESSKPLARYSNDEDLERHLKEQERPEDPMLEYMRQKRKEKEKQSGKPQIPCYEGPYPENRFGIRPGYRWDGVDRSNGYEKKYFAVQNEKRARQEEAYKYSVEDM